MGGKAPVWQFQPERKVFTVADLLGKKEGDNPHFWYSPDYVTQVINQVEADLKKLDPSKSAYFDAQRATLNTAMEHYWAGSPRSRRGSRARRCPPQSRSSSTSSKQARVLVYNEQTSTAVTTNIRKLAASADIPVVGVTETVQPPDASFEQWFEGGLDQLQNALNAKALAG